MERRKTRTRKTNESRVSDRNEINQLLKRLDIFIIRKMKKIPVIWNHERNWSEVRKILTCLTQLMAFSSSPSVNIFPTYTNFRPNAFQRWYLWSIKKKKKIKKSFLIELGFLSSVLERERRLRRERLKKRVGGNWLTASN